MSYSPEDIRDHLSGAVAEARDMLAEALQELEDVENVISDMECNL